MKCIPGIRDLFLRSACVVLVALAGIPCIAAQEQPAWVERLPVKLSEADIARFTAFDENRQSAVAEALGTDSPADRAGLQRVLAGEPQPIGEKDLLGEWRCRTLKLGGILPLVIYNSFKCRIFQESGVLVLQKTSGSQRTRGALYRIAADRFAYVGAGSLNDDPPAKYGDNAEENEVAFLAKAAPKRLRLEFPAPHRESHFDIIELVR
jgi:hypothetical protein